MNLARVKYINIMSIEIAKDVTLLQNLVVFENIDRLVHISRQFL